MTKERRVELGQLLEERRRQMRQDVQRHIRTGRTERLPEAGDTGDLAEGGTQEGIGFALLQQKSETLERVDEALLRIEAGEYGICLACHGEISEPRLRALPFAVRCTTCEERHERHAREHRGMRVDEATSIFAHVTHAGY